MGYEPRGRPLKASGEKLSKQITIKLAPSQKKIIDGEARRCGMNTSEFIRGVLLGVLKERVQEESKAEGPEKEPEEESGGSGPDDSESDLIYPKPVPEDFQELTSFLTEARDKAKSSEDVIDLREVVKNFRFQLERWVDDYRMRIRYGEEVRSEARGETRGTTDIEKKAERIYFRVRPKDHAWLQEIHARDKGVNGGLSTSIRSIVSAWPQDDMLLRDLHEHLMPKWTNTFDQLRRTEEPSEMREKIISLADQIEKLVEEKMMGIRGIELYT